MDLLTNDRGFMIYGLWVGTVTCIAFGILFGSVAAIFAIINTSITPIESITGVAGLYIWNFIASKYTKVM